jgi:predicted transposase/invertase (TIGR01784 family)
MADEIVSPLEDFAFSQIFGNQRNISITKAFLKTLLDIPEEEYHKLTVVSPILGRFFKKDKMSIVDLKLTTKSGKIIHIELQVEKRSNLKNRIMYYSARLIGDQLKFGDDYNKLHQVVSIVICNHILLDGEESYINMYELRNQKNHRFTDLVKVVILELPKLSETKDSKVWPWLRFFTCERKEEYEMLAKRHPELEEAVFCAKRMSLLDQWRDYQFHKNLWKVDERNLREQIRIDAQKEGHKEGHEEGLREGHKEGHKEGREQGIAEGMVEGREQGIAEGMVEGREQGIAKGMVEGREQEKLEIAKKMKEANMPLMDILQFTGLEPETIDKL